MARKKKENTGKEAPKTKGKAKTTNKEEAQQSLIKMSQIHSALGKFFKEGDLGVVELDHKSQTRSHPHNPTGSVVVDFLIGGQPNEKGVKPCPGFPKGRLINVYGMESSGKTTLALTAAATVIQNGGRVCFIDWEHAIDLRYAFSLGIPRDPEKFFMVQPRTLETGMAVAYTMARGKVDLVIFDSVTAGVPKAIMDQKLDAIGELSGGMGLDARLWSEFLRKFKESIAKSGTSAVGISQLRHKVSPGSMGPKTQTAGGNAWKFYSELRIMLTRVKTEKGKIYSSFTNKVTDGATGIHVRARIDKCKVAPTQGMEADFFIRFGEGIDDVRSIIDAAQAHGIISKKGSWFVWERATDPVKAQGIEGFRTKLLGTQGAWEELHSKTMERVSSASSDGVILDTEEDVDVEVEDFSFITGSD